MMSSDNSNNIPEKVINENPKTSMRDIYMFPLFYFNF